MAAVFLGKQKMSLIRSHMKPDPSLDYSRLVYLGKINPRRKGGIVEGVSQSRFGNFILISFYFIALAKTTQKTN